MHRALVRSLFVACLPLACQGKETPPQPAAAAPSAPTVATVAATATAADPAATPTTVHEAVVAAHHEAPAKPGSASHSETTGAETNHAETAVEHPAAVAEAAHATATATAAAPATAAATSTPTPAQPAATVAAATSTSDKPPKPKDNLFAAGVNPATGAAASGDNKGTADTERHHRTINAPTRPGAERK
ncbi:MAG TPA: hypothetical protein VHC69_11000 [Polyangiaceae bacterium]|nr:hypothetical protein [Polyangiaceae bacterium]